MNDHSRLLRLSCLLTLHVCISAGANAGQSAAGVEAGQEAGARESIELSTPKVIKLPSKAELKAAAQEDAKGRSAPAKPVPPSASAKEAAASKPAVSMAELRELIDQKIAEVRAKQETAPVVAVPNRAPKVASRPRPKAATRVAVPLVDEGHDVHWAYEGATGPGNWATLKPEFKQCALGKRQSPIDIRDGIRVQLEPIQFDYHPTPFTVLDNGHTVQVNLPPGNGITVSGRRYELLQFHFHRPSEERINGHQYEMVAHLVHKDKEGRLAVVAVLMDQGKAHPMVQLVWNSLPLERHTDQASPVAMDLNQMLPEQRQYYTYMGSLTTPPCSEGVLWMVMKQPATMTPEQIAIFARLYPMNARPLQSASNRLIKDGQ